ncbi:hypothetical protein PFICI_09340 [Pestalotiopsis fici W106-1]|uniref:Uncharacterized protein n=1 Tax=Pestalotiopsis fici (strain W106-1 / CGMCC3.15140) TaxID=1229662 RepID=W3X275_PESFW|nr:uncharacterized protein PFICI_09340 [Pestalotiopsis fici W106-1]ETS79487.1 hypothetical protein PFICI_09340 [Pestalotiopsis fici W106-1]
MLDDCLKDSQVIILPCEPAGSHISRERHADLARAIILGLRRLRQQKSDAVDAAAAAGETTAALSYQPPSVIQLRSPVQQPASSSEPPPEACWLPRMIHRIATFRRSHGGGCGIGSSGRRSRRAEYLFTKAAAERSEKGEAALIRHTFVDLSPGVDCEPRGKRRHPLRSKFGRRKRKHEAVVEDDDFEATTLLGDEYPLAKKSFYSRLLQRKTRKTSATDEPKNHRWSVLVDDHSYAHAAPTPPAYLEKTVVDSDSDSDSDSEEVYLKSQSRKWISCLFAGMCYIGMAIGTMPHAIPEQTQVY